MTFNDPMRYVNSGSNMKQSQIKSFKNFIEFKKRNLCEMSVIRDGRWRFIEAFCNC